MEVFSPKPNNTKIRVKFDGSCLKQEITFTHKKVLNIYIVCEINLWPFKQSTDFGLKFFYLELLS